MLLDCIVQLVIGYVNEEMLDTIDIEAHVFKSTDGGIKYILKADETLALLFLK